MAAAAEDASDVEKLYEYGERLNEAKDKSEVSLHLSLSLRGFFFSRVLAFIPMSLLGFRFSIWFSLPFFFLLLQHIGDYEGIIRAAKGSMKAKQLAAQLIPRFFKFFPSLTTKAFESHFDLCEEEELGVRFSI